MNVFRHLAFFAFVFCLVFFGCKRHEKLSSPVLGAWEATMKWPYGDEERNHFIVKELISFYPDQLFESSMALFVVTSQCNTILLRSYTYEGSYEYGDNMLLLYDVEVSAETKKENVTDYKKYALRYGERDLRNYFFNCTDAYRTEHLAFYQGEFMATQMTLKGPVQRLYRKAKAEDYNPLPNIATIDGIF